MYVEISIGVAGMAFFMSGCWKTGIIVEELKPVNPKKV